VWIKEADSSKEKKHYLEKKKTKKGKDENPSTRSTRQVKAREHMSLKNITIRTPLIH
jgi:hypothetical protein